MKNLIKSVVFCSMMMWWVNQWLAQNINTKTTKEQTKEILIENHETIIQKSYEDIIWQYGLEKWITIIRKHMLIEINKERKNIWLEPFQDNQLLSNAAQEHAEFLKKNYDMYYGPNSKADTHVQFFQDWRPFRVIWDRTQAAGYPWVFTTECIVNWAKNIKDAIEWRMLSPPHKAKILSKNTYTEIWSWFAIWDGKYISVLNLWNQNKPKN